MIISTEHRMKRNSNAGVLSRYTPDEDSSWPAFPDNIIAKHPLQDKRSKNSWVAVEPSSLSMSWKWRYKALCSLSKTLQAYRTWAKSQSPLSTLFHCQLVYCCQIGAKAGLLYPSVWNAKLPVPGYVKRNTSDLYETRMDSEWETY